MTLLRCANVCPALCVLQISELSVDLESKQKELQSLQHDKSCLEQQLMTLVRTAGHSGFLRQLSGVSERPVKDRSTRMCVTGLIKRSIYPQTLLCTLVPVIIPLGSGDKNVPPYVISSGKLVLLCFRNKSWKMRRRRAGGWRRPHAVNVSAELFSPLCQTRRYIRCRLCCQSWSRVWSCPEKTASS